MPQGTQEVLQGIVCLTCHQVLANVSEVSELLCTDCEEQFVCTCDGCYSTGINYTSLNYSTIILFRQNNVVTDNFYRADDSGEWLCEDCLVPCPRCDNVFQWDENAGDCCEDEGPSCVNYYSYTPLYRFYSCDANGVGESSSIQKIGPLYMGIELEIARMRDIADSFYDELSPEESVFVYMKEDGSIGPNGVELVTMPATLDAFKQEFPFDALDSARVKGARSFAYESCGFHIHVSRSAFSATHMWKFIKFQLNNPRLCQKIAQRDNSEYATWYYENDEISSLPDFVKGKRTNNRRYLAINFQNRATVELRYFKGNILKEAILKNLEFVQSLYDYTKGLSVQDVMTGGLRETSYFDWLSDVTDNYPNLWLYLSGQNKENE